MRGVLTYLVLAGISSYADSTSNAPAASAAAQPPIQARVAQYRGDCAAALSYTFDDGTHDQLQVVPLLNAHGFHGTFLIIASRVPDTEAEVAAQHMVSWGSISWEKLRELQAEGHEMSSHSWSHPNMTKLDEAGIRAEVEKADQLMAQKLGQPPLTFCYPGNGYTDQIRAIVLEHHVNDRIQCTGLAGPTFTVDSANEWVDELIHDHNWGVTMIHNVNNTDPNVANLNVLNGQMDYVKSRSAQVWVDTFLNVSLYTKERDAAKLAVTTTGLQQADVLLTCSLTPVLYHFPLTVVVTLPGVKDATASIGQSTLPVRVLKDAVQLELVPGPQAVSLSWK